MGRPYFAEKREEMGGETAWTGGINRIRSVTRVAANDETSA